MTIDDPRIVKSGLWIDVKKLSQILAEMENVCQAERYQGMDIKPISKLENNYISLKSAFF